MDIRKARRKDIAKITELARAGGLYRYPLMLYWILITLGWVQIVEEHGITIGFYSYVLLPYCPVAFMLQIALVSTHQKKGLGSQLLAGILNFLSSKKVKLVKAHTLKPHVSAWLVKNGFTEMISFGGVRVLKKYL